jgi:hypothetical protein
LNQRNPRIRLNLQKISFTLGKVLFGSRVVARIDEVRYLGAS